MYIIHIWLNSDEKSHSIKHKIISKNLANSLVEFNDVSCDILSEISWVDYEFVSNYNLDSLIKELIYFSNKNKIFEDEIYNSLINLVYEAKTTGNIILFDPFDQNSY